MDRRVCITGIGVINPSGLTNDEFWDNVVSGKNSISEIDRFDCSHYPSQVAGQLNGFIASDYVPRRFEIKTDTFIHYAWAAAKNALTDACIDLKNYDRTRVGVWFGNNAGGWDICERGLYELFKEGPEFVNPWQATAWFLTAPQGYLTISNDIRGISKSFVCDRATSSSALYHAIKSIKRGHNDLIITGGTEAPISAFAMNCYLGTGDLAKCLNDTHCYKPFDKGRCGLVVGEGSTVIIIEEMEHALARGATIYGEFVSEYMNTDYDSSSSHFLYKNIKYSLEKANLISKDIDIIFPEGAAVPYSDDVESEVITEIFSNDKAKVSIPKSG